MINISTPPMDFSFSAVPWHELEGMKGKFISYKDGIALIDEEYYALRRALIETLMKEVDKKRGGVYIIESATGVMYVGKSSKVRERLVQHLTGNGGATSGYVKDMSTVRGFHVDDPYERDIYETYLVKEMSPLLNINKRSRWL